MKEKRCHQPRSASAQARWEGVHPVQVDSVVFVVVAAAAAAAGDAVAG
jgi:hypothetical protein